jgi:hypothetical protein
MKKQISWAKVLNSQEVTDYKKKLTSKQNKKQESSEYCRVYIEKLIKAHSDFERHKKAEQFRYAVDAVKRSHFFYNQRIEKAKEIDQYFDQFLNWDNTPQCDACGADLVYRASHDFISCSNYRAPLTEGKKHTTINRISIPEKPTQNPEDITLDSIEISLGKNYLSEFKEYAGIPKWVMVSVIYEYLFQVNEVKCLCPDLSADYFTIAPNNSRRANMDEQVIEGVLRNHFPKVTPQVHINFRYIDESYKYLKIPDFICTRPGEVFVFDVKKNTDNCDLDRLDLYHELVEFLVNQNKMVQVAQVHSYHLIYGLNELTAHDREVNRCVTVQDLRNGKL